MQHSPWGNSQVVLLIQHIWGMEVYFEPDKSEVMFFQCPYTCNLPPPLGWLTLLEGPTQYHVTLKETLHYLGLFLHWKLKWTSHMTIMCNQAHTPICYVVTEH